MEETSNGHLWARTDCSTFLSLSVEGVVEISLEAVHMGYQLQHDRVGCLRKPRPRKLELIGSRSISLPKSLPRCRYKRRYSTLGRIRQLHTDRGLDRVLFGRHSTGVYVRDFSRAFPQSRRRTHPDTKLFVRPVFRDKIRVFRRQRFIHNPTPQRKLEVARYS